MNAMDKNCDHALAATDHLYGEAFGNPSQFSGSFNEVMESILENRAFMQNLRTGGAANGCVVDGVVRSAEPFSTGEAWIKVAFRQR
jgi:hypothetical protein